MKEQGTVVQRDAKIPTERSERRLGERTKGREKKGLSVVSVTYSKASVFGSSRTQKVLRGFGTPNDASSLGHTTDN